MQKYTFHRDGVPEPVSKEDWRWEVGYEDGSGLKQFDDETGLFHQVGEIDQSRLRVFRMVHDDLPAHTLLFEPSMRLIHKYRRMILDNGSKRLTWYIFGYKKGKDYLYTVITPLETITTTDLDKLRLE